MNVAELLDLMLDYELNHTNRKGFGPFHITYDRWNSLTYNKKPKYNELIDREISELFIINYWKQYYPDSLRKMDVHNLLTHWYGTCIINTKWWPNVD